MAGNLDDDWEDVPGPQQQDDWQDVPKGRDITPVESGAVGAVQGLSFGFGDEIAGAALGAKDYIQGKGYNYRDRQKEIESYINKTRDANPGSYMTGAVGGAVGGALVPGLNLLAPVKGASMLANVGRVAGAGALSGVGESSGDLSSMKGVEQVASDAALGGTIGAATQGVGQKLGGALESLSPSKLKETAAFRAFKASSGQNKKAFKDAVKTGQLTSKGSALLDSDEAGKPVIGWLSSAEDIGPPAKEKADFFGKKIGDVAKEIDAAMPNSVSGQEIADNIMEYAARVPDTGNNQGIIDKLIKEAERYQSMGNIPFEKAQNLKNGYVFKVTDTSTQGFGQDATNALKNIVGDSMDSSAARMSQIAADSGDERLSNILGNYGKYKEKYGAFKTASDVAEQRSVANMSNRFISPSDYGLGLGGALYGGMQSDGDLSDAAMLGLGLGMGNKFLRTRGSAMTAKGANLLGNVLEKTPQAAQSISGTATKAIQSGGAPLGQAQLIEEYLINDRKKRNLP